MALRVAEDPLLGSIPQRFEVGHYHSWCADRSSLPEAWTITAEVASDPSIVLALRHGSLPLHAVQFHPESVLTPQGRGVLEGWLSTLRK